MKLMLLGAVAMACFIVGVFFLRSWKLTRDRFFLFFAMAFIIDGISRILLGVIPYSNEQEPLFYLGRLLSFMIILWAVIDKNFIKKRKSKKL